MIFWIAMIVLNVIAITAILVANRELDKALREMDRLSSARLSERIWRSASLAASQARAGSHFKECSPHLDSSLCVTSTTPSASNLESN
ncbi:MAG: hypothetical protein DID90_2727554277 [Candidatus Nitrotoga sp. LAW]|nr:MAG: hypothetical protein DID90_2727554277 [Candidatus Nitrotoga sp. LAW]